MYIVANFSYYDIQELSDPWKHLISSIQSRHSCTTQPQSYQSYQSIIKLEDSNIKFNTNIKHNMPGLSQLNKTTRKHYINFTLHPVDKTNSEIV